MGNIPIRNYPYTRQSAHQHRVDEDTIVNNIYGNVQLPVPDFPYPSSLEFFGAAYLLPTPLDEVLLGFPCPSMRLQQLMPPSSSDRRRSGEESTDTETANLTRTQLRLGETPPQPHSIGSKLIAMAVETQRVATSSRASAAECSTAASSVIYDRTQDSDTISSQQRQTDLDRLRPSMQRPQYYSSMVQGATRNKRQKLGDGDGDVPE